MWLKLLKNARLKKEKRMNQRVNARKGRKGSPKCSVTDKEWLQPKSLRINLFQLYFILATLKMQKVILLQSFQTGDFYCSVFLNVIEQHSRKQDHSQVNLNQYPVIFPSKINIAERRTNSGLRLL